MIGTSFKIFVVELGISRKEIKRREKGIILVKTVDLNVDEFEFSF